MYIATSCYNFLKTGVLYFSPIQNTHLSRSLRWAPGDCLGNLGEDSSNKQSVIPTLVLGNVCFLAFWKSPTDLKPNVSIIGI